MLITCDNKGCLKSTDAQLDPNTKDVICLECEKPIHNVSEAMKRVLRSAGQIVRHVDKKPFTMACMNCYANREVLLDDKNDTVCGVCHQPINVHAAMRLAMEETGTKLRRLSDVQKAEPTKIENPVEETAVKKAPKKAVKKRATRKTEE